MLPATAAALAVLAALLAWPVPALLARARGRPRRAGRAAGVAGPGAAGPRPLAAARSAGGPGLLAGDRAHRRPVDHRRAVGARPRAVGSLAARGGVGRGRRAPRGGAG